MHFCTFSELKRLQNEGIEPIKEILPENEFPFERKTKKVIEGRLDFIVKRNDGKTVGFEVLTRPSQGKMKNKLGYAKYLDNFIFVIPKNSMDLYIKSSKNGNPKLCRDKSFECEFCGKNLEVWILDIGSGKFEAKGTFAEVFNVDNCRILH